MYKFSFTIFALLLFSFNFSVTAQDDGRASVTWQVQKYEITASLPQNETDRNLTVKAALNMKNVSGGAANSLSLRISPSAEIEKVIINGKETDFSKREEKINSVNSLQKIVIRVPSIQPDQILTTSVNYKINIKENSGLSALSPVYAQFLPLSYWYPTPNSWYFARGADYAPFTLNVSAPNNLTVLSSGVESANTFNQKLNAQPFFTAGSWDKIESNSVAVYLPKGAGTEVQKRAQELTALLMEAKNFTGSLLGAMPEVPLRIVSIKRGAGFSDGGTIFVDESVFRRQKIDSQTAMAIADSVAKIWLGNAVIVNNDAYGVIREGLSKYIATEFIDSKYGKEIADIERLRQRTAYAAIVKRDSPLSIVSSIDDYYYTAVSNKGAMIWRLLARKIGKQEFFNVLQTNLKDGNLQMNELRSALSANKELFDYALDQITDTNLLIGLPQSGASETKVALRNTGSVEASITITAQTANGEKINSQSTIPAKSFSEVIFKTPSKISRVEIDSEKLYPQTEYSDDVAPREFDDSDALLIVKRLFDKQDFVSAEKNARNILLNNPRFDDVRILLARSLLAQGKITDAEREFRAVLEERLPTARSIGWANVGLGEIAAKTGSPQALKYFEEAISADAEYGSTLAARNGRNKVNNQNVIDEKIKSFFVQFDKSAVSGRKADIDSVILPGEIPKFSGGVAGAQEWQTQILMVDKLDSNNVLVETNLNIKLLNKSAENGKAVYRLTKVNDSWKLTGIEMFEVR